MGRGVMCCWGAVFEGCWLVVVVGREGVIGKDLAASVRVSILASNWSASAKKYSLRNAAARHCAV
eukprot:5246534-Amphidinium_carterae.1